MKTNVFYTPVTSKQIQENIEKQFDSRVNLVKYNREQLEDMRNKLRTKIFQHESTAKYNDLLTNETYQKDQAMLQLLNTRIREMLGEDIKKLRDKMVEISEGKANRDYDGDGRVEKPKAEVWGSRAKAAAKAGHPFGKKEVEESSFEDRLEQARKKAKEKGRIKDKEEEEPSNVRQVKGKAYGGSKQTPSEKPGHEEDDDDDDEDTPAKKTAAKKTAAKKTAAKKTAARKKNTNESAMCNQTDEGTMCPVHGMTECGGMWEGADDPDDKGEYDNEGDMAKDQLHTIRREADRLEKIITDEENLPEWVQDKLARIKGMMSDVSEYMQTQDERDEEDDTGEEGFMSSDDDELTMAEGKKWVQKAVKGIKKGALRKQEHMKKGEKFGKGKLKSLAKGGTPTERKRAQFALNISKKNESHFIDKVNYIVENVHRMINEDEEGKAKTITAASDMVNDFTSWMQRVGQYQTKALVELADAINADVGAADAETFKQAVSPALSQTLETLTSQREVIANAVAVLAGEQSAQPQMGAEPGAEEPGMEPSGPDTMNEPTAGGDEFGASEAGAGEGASGRQMRESRAQRRARKLAESHSILSKLAR